MSLRKTDQRVNASPLHIGFVAALHEPGVSTCRAGVASDLVRGSLLGRSLARLVLCGSLSVTASGCSISVPMSGFVADPISTGSIERSDVLLYKALDQEDGRRAKAALAVALDPQGNGASVAWNNPQSGAKGTFVALAAPFTRNDRICRAFRAHVTPDPKSERDVDGSACRNAEGEWHIAEAKEAGKTRS